MYTPGMVPMSADEIPGFLQQELHNLQRAINSAAPFAWLQPLHQEPKRLLEGMVVLADGVDWNPGSGAGFYGYRAGAWRFLG